MSLHISRDPDASLRQLLQAAAAQLNATADNVKSSAASLAHSAPAPVNASRSTTLSSSTLAFLSEHGGASALGGVDSAKAHPGAPVDSHPGANGNSAGASPASGGHMPSLEEYIMTMLGGDPVGALKTTG